MNLSDWFSASILVISVVATSYSVMSFLSVRRRQDFGAQITRSTEIIRNNTSILEKLTKVLGGGVLSAADPNLHEMISRISSTRAEEVTITERLITSYHEQAISQSRIQFNISIAASIVGFGLIIASFFLSSTSTYDVLVRTSPGAIIDVIAALFFKQASDTRKRATDLYDRLRTDNQKMLSFEIAETIEDPSLKSRVKAQIALHIAGLPKEVLEPVQNK